MNYTDFQKYRTDSIVEFYVILPFNLGLKHNEYYLNFKEPLIIIITLLQ